MCSDSSNRPPMADQAGVDQTVDGCTNGGWHLGCDKHGGIGSLRRVSFLCLHKRTRTPRWATYSLDVLRLLQEKDANDFMSLSKGIFELPACAKGISGRSFRAEPNQGGGGQ